MQAHSMCFVCVTIRQRAQQHLFAREFQYHQFEVNEVISIYGA